MIFLLVMFCGSGKIEGIFATPISRRCWTTTRSSNAFFDGEPRSETLDKAVADKKTAEEEKSLQPKEAEEEKTSLQPKKAAEEKEKTFNKKGSQKKEDLQPKKDGMSRRICLSKRATLQEP